MKRFEDGVERGRKKRGKGGKRAGRSWSKGIRYGTLHDVSLVFGSIYVAEKCSIKHLWYSPTILSIHM